uniref:Transcription factor 19 (SC1), like n=1 Tax=Echeneis naucrates TaxID=173247 RepID=A0A665V6X6_ECHNA
MLSGVQPCFQLIRIGSSLGDSARDLYTFRPALSRSVFRLGRAAELCDVTLDSASVSRIHAELHAEREASGGDATNLHQLCSCVSGTWVNDVRLQPGVQWELSDGDTLTFGGQSVPGSPEFYFLFQKVKVRPLDFDAITIPKVEIAGTFSSDLQNRIRTNPDRKVEANLDLSKLSINRATVILNSIGSLSKMKGSAWTFKRSYSHEGTVSDPGSSSSPPLTVASVPSTKSLPPTSRSRRKSAHTVLLEDDSSDEPRSRGGEAYTLSFLKIVKILKVCWKSPYVITAHFNRRGRPRKHPVPLLMTGVVEPCAAPRCRLPQQDTVQWIQCDVCDAWYHIDCLHVDRKKLLVDPNADFHCGCC